MKAMNSPMSRHENRWAGKSASGAVDVAPEKARGKRPIVWRKSSYCQSGECVEVSALDGMVMVRDSKAPQAGTLSFNADEFRSFVRGVVAGEFNDLADS